MSHPHRRGGILGTPYLLPMLAIAALVIVVSHAVPWMSAPILASQLRTQQKLLLDLVNYQRLLSSLDESSRAVVLAPHRADLRQKKINAIQDLRDQFDLLAADAPIEGNIPHSLIGLATHFRKEVVGKADEVDRYAMAPGDWGIERFRKHYGAARAEHEVLVQSLMNETRGIADQALQSSQSRLTLSASVLVLLWAATLSYFTLRARKEAVLAHSLAATDEHAAAGAAGDAHTKPADEQAGHAAPATATGSGTQFRNRQSPVALETSHTKRASVAAASIESSAPVAPAVASTVAQASPAAGSKPNHPSLVAQADLDGLVHSHPTVPEEAPGSVVDLAALGNEVAAEGTPEGGVIDLNALLAEEPAPPAAPAPVAVQPPVAPPVEGVASSVPAPGAAPVPTPVVREPVASAAVEIPAPAPAAIPELGSDAGPAPSPEAIDVGSVPAAIDLSDLVPAPLEPQPTPPAPAAPPRAEAPSPAPMAPADALKSAPAPELKPSRDPAAVATSPITDAIQTPSPVASRLEPASTPAPVADVVSPATADPVPELPAAPPAEIDLSDLLPPGTPSVSASSAPPAAAAAAATQSTAPATAPLAVEPASAPTPIPAAPIASPKPKPVEKAPEGPPKGSAAALAAASGGGGKARGGTQDVKELMKDAGAMTADQLTAMLFGGRGNAPADPPKPAPAAAAPPPQPPRTITGADVAAPADGAGPIDLSF